MGPIFWPVSYGQVFVNYAYKYYVRMKMINSFVVYGLACDVMYSDEAAVYVMMIQLGRVCTLCLCIWYICVRYDYVTGMCACVCVCVYVMIMRLVMIAFQFAGAS